MWQSVWHKGGKLAGEKDRVRTLSAGTFPVIDITFEYNTMNTAKHQTPHKHNILQIMGVGGAFKKSMSRLKQAKSRGDSMQAHTHICLQHPHSRGVKREGTGTDIVADVDGGGVE